MRVRCVCTLVVFTVQVIVVISESECYLL